MSDLNYAAMRMAQMTDFQLSALRATYQGRYYSPPEDTMSKEEFDNHVKAAFVKAFAKKGMQGPHVEEAVADAIKMLDKATPPPPAPAPVEEEQKDDEIIE